MDPISILGAVAGFLGTAGQLAYKSYEHRQEAPIVARLESYRACEDQKCRSRQRRVIVRLDGALPKPARELLPPLWSARSRWQRDLTVALIESKLAE